MLAGDGVTVRVAVPEKELCSIGTYTVTFTRKGAPPQVVKLKRDGTVSNVFFEDVTGDGKRDLVVFFTSAGSGAYGRLDIWEWKVDRFRAGIVSDLMPDQRTGYQGHDLFTAAAGVLRRRIPALPGGGRGLLPVGRDGGLPLGCEDEHLGSRIARQDPEPPHPFRQGKVTMARPPSDTVKLRWEPPVTERT